MAPCRGRTPPPTARRLRELLPAVVRPLSLRACSGRRWRGLTESSTPPATLILSLRGAQPSPSPCSLPATPPTRSPFDSGNVCASNGDRGYVYVTNGCATPITVGLEVRRRRARERAARRRLWAKKLLGTRVEAQREQGGRALCVAPPCGRSPAGPDPQRAAQQRLALAVALGPETRVAPCLEARRRDHGAWLMTLIG